MNTQADQEEHIVAELQSFGIQYLSQKTPVKRSFLRSPENLLADLICQPTSRVRTAFIPVLLANPDLAQVVPSALNYLEPDEKLLAKILYTAAVILQQKYLERLEHLVKTPWKFLPNLYASELGVSDDLSVDEQLHSLGLIHIERTGVHLNWVGTYEKAATNLIRHLELEEKWKQYQP